MNFDNQSTENKAWAVAADPSASEKQWMAACTVLDGKRPQSSQVSKRIHPAVGLPWSLFVSGLSGLGAFMIFGFLSAAVCEAAAMLTGWFYAFNGPHAFALLGAAFITFSWVFTYQQHIWNGGRMWSILHYGLVACGALLPFSLELFFATPSSVGNLCLFALWGAGFVSLSALTAKLTRRSIKQLDSTIGAQRVMPFSRALFACSGSLLLVLTAAPWVITVFSAMWFWLPALLIGSGYYIATANNARNTQTATTLALAAWNPLIIANAILLPALLINSVCALFFPLLQVGVADYAVGIGTLLCLAIGPLLGGTAAARMMRRNLELELHEMPNMQAQLIQNPQSNVAALGEEPACETT